MLTFEAVRPVRLNTKTLGVVRLEPGERLTWPTPAVESLLARIPERIRLVEGPAQLHPGVWVEFDSPLFGMVTARILSVELDRIWITDHSILKGEGEPVTIPAAWVRGIYREQAEIGGHP